MEIDVENIDPYTIEQKLDEYAEDKEITDELVLKLIGAYCVDEYNEEGWQAYAVDSFIADDGDRYSGVRFDNLREFEEKLK